MACIVEFNINFLRFLSKFGMNLQQSRDSECGDATYHNPNKKVVVSQVLLQPSGSHSRNHHAKRHKSGTDGIVCRLVLAVGKVNEVEHVGCESETVSELFDEDANVDKQQGIRLCIAEVYINKIR